MKNFNIVKLDAKGRILVPFHIRQHLGLENDVELVVINNGTRELKLYPLVPGQSAKINVIMKDLPGSLASVMNYVSANGIDVLMSESKTVEKGKTATWHALVDISSCKDITKVKKDLKALANVDTVEVVRK